MGEAPLFSSSDYFLDLTQTKLKADTIVNNNGNDFLQQNFSSKIYFTLFKKISLKKYNKVKY